MNQVFRRVGSLRPGRSAFDLSYEKKTTCDMGQLIPVLCEEVLPGDTWQVGNRLLIRFQPLVAPIMHEINAYIHYFFVPYRILWEDWEDFITGGVDGEFATPIPRWVPTDVTIGSLWDQLGFPTGFVPAAGATPLDFPRRAYNRIFNEYYRDETLYPEVAETNEVILNRSWEKDYFTSALPFQQRGTAPSLPISGTSFAEWPAYVAASQGQLLYNTASDVPYNSGGKAFLENNVVDLSSATTFNVADLRLVVQIQKWLERNARAGARYIEFLQAHWGVHPRDERLQRPEYIGGSKNPVIVSEVLQTSATEAGSAQGNQAGHAIVGGGTFCGKYTATENGLIMGIMSVMPRSAYQQGVDRQWLRETKYDFPFPEFVNLSEQGVTRAEIYASNNEVQNRTLFGYQGRFDECRVKRSMICGLMRTTFNYWHLGRIFTTAPELNEDFITCDPAATKRIFAVQDEPGLIVNIGNMIRAVRPLPVMAEPGLLDHN